MNTILYYNRHTVAAANDMAVTATTRFGVPPRRMKIGVDVTQAEVEDLVVIDLDRMELPILTSADDDNVIDLLDTDEEVEIADYEADPTWLFRDYNGN